MSVLERNAIHTMGNGTEIMLFVHGFGCDQNMWRYITPAFLDEYKIVLLDLVGSGSSDLTNYDFDKYNNLQGYADDIIEICQELNLDSIIFVGHSVSAMIGALIDKTKPNLITRLVMVSPSPCYINKEDYVGGFSSEDIDELLEALETNYLGWSSSITPAIMGNEERPELAEELENSFCRNDPKIAEHFARVTFLGDYRDELKNISAKTLILQCHSDVIAPIAVGEYMNKHIGISTLNIMQATGHCPHLSAPAETIDLITNFLLQH